MGEGHRKTHRGTANYRSVNVVTVGKQCSETMFTIPQPLNALVPLCDVVCSATTKSPRGCSCQHPTDPSSTTAYTSLLQYDRLANGWKMPPGPWGDCDYTFSMRFTLKSDDDDQDPVGWG